ncbi:MAG: YkvA family protein [Saprospiraceae bacterium]
MKKEPKLTSTVLSSLRKKIKYISSSLLYAALLMYYAFRRNETPAWAKRIVMGVFVYLFAPIDAIPDLTPVIGYTDDMGVMLYGLVLIAAYINEDVRLSARRTLESWIGPVDQESLRQIDERL